MVEKSAVLNSGYTDLDYKQMGAELVDTAQQLYACSQLIVKVKQPLAQDIAAWSISQFGDYSLK